jgi:hypothetical protein
VEGSLGKRFCRGFRVPDKHSVPFFLVSGDGTRLTRGLIVTLILNRFFLSKCGSPLLFIGGTWIFCASYVACPLGAGAIVLWILLSALLQIVWETAESMIYASFRQHVCGTILTVMGSAVIEYLLDFRRLSDTFREIRHAHDPLQRFARGIEMALNPFTLDEPIQHR